MVKFKSLMELAFDNGCGQWATQLLSFGIHNSGHNVRRMLMDFFLQTGVAEKAFMQLINRNWRLLTDIVIPGLDDMGLFDAGASGSAESPFGKLLVQFFTEFVGIFNDMTEFDLFLKAVIYPLAECQSFFPALFVFTGIAEGLLQQQAATPNRKIWNEIADFKTLNKIMAIQGSFAPESCRPLLRMAMLPCVERLAAINIGEFSIQQR